MISLQRLNQPFYTPLHRRNPIRHASPRHELTKSNRHPRPGLIRLGLLRRGKISGRISRMLSAGPRPVVTHRGSHASNYNTRVGTNLLGWR